MEFSAALASEAGARSCLLLFALAWLRVAPAALLVPSLGLGVPSGTLSWLLGFAAAFALLPGLFALSPELPQLSSQLLAAGFCELARGLALGLGCALPLWVFSANGWLADAVRGALPGLPQAASPLAVLYGSAALIAVFGLALPAGLGRVLFAALLDAPLLVPPAFEPSRALLLEVAWLVLRAFAIGVALSAPMLLAGFAIALLVALLSLLGTGAARALGASGLWPYVGLGAASLTLLGLLDRAPQVATVLLRETGRLLGRLEGSP